MATITSAGSGLWSAGTTWVGGVAPVDNDVVVIASGHVVEFDVDQSGFANGIDGITITGTLKLTRTAGTYYLKIKAAKTIGGTGVFDCGASALDIIPFAAKHTITGGAGWYITGAAGMSMTVYAAEPVIKTVKLTGAEAIGATVLHVDTDITGDIWADGDTIRISNINKTNNVEERIIAAGGIAAGSITITAGLTSAKITGARIALISRNVKIMSNSASTGALIQGFGNGKLIIAGGQFRNYGDRLLTSSTGVAISGGTFVGSYAVVYVASSISISGGVFSCSTLGISDVTSLSISGGVFFGASFGLVNACIGAIISGGVFNGAAIGINACVGLAISGGEFIGNASAIYSCSGASIVAATFTGNGKAIDSSSVALSGAVTFLSNTHDINASLVTAININFTSTTEINLYASLSKYSFSYSIDHDQVAGAYKAWTKGGVTSSQASVLPTGYTTAMQTVLENAAVEGYWQKEYTVGAGASIQFTMNLRKAASMTYLPRCIIFNKASADPFAGGAGLHTFTMTDSIDTWEAESWTYTNSTAADVTLVVRFQGMHATATFFSALLAEQINVDLTTALAQIAAVKAKTDNLPADPADQSAVEAAITGSIVEGTITYQQALRLMLAVLAGKASGGGTTTVTFRDTGDTKARVTATVDSNGNRSAVVLDGA